ncbi:hypothetical protein EMIHUDRAFT_451443 [Emiliania huxleyi CCMP1516]|uniref:Uncharacterized protein n=2 Tax=Emiliania huxleyi TaxID=2903 RepID=A0A0D3IZQ6_EMIH1|nr:hypothetical protein EMIHUDRAFT_451443 [Emiliania huxleyi CCMP1516]EOD16741.1 hypothetical protein EMIHUDRAFT_451443 [Emiliania huxleyi CCMP1516]|eukprot:XP_005769170.1 hypothetical protein EMIHUDRAFT_451443 [Emiliania huxleyi CCMP1516]
MSTVRASRGLFERALLALPVGENARVFLGVCTVVGVAGAFTASKRGVGYDSMADKRAAEEKVKKEGS